MTTTLKHNSPHQLGSYQPVISTEAESSNYLQRVPRPLRPIQYIPKKAITYEVSGPDSLLQFTYGRTPLPVDPDSVVISVKYAALNPLDYKLKNSQWSYPGSKGIGKDYCGEIMEVGDNLKKVWQVGDLVCGMYLKMGEGTLSTNIVVNPSVEYIVKVPSLITPEQAAAWPMTFGTAYQSLKYVDTGSLEYSSLLIVGGATSVGIMAIQLAKQQFGFSNVVVTCSSDSEELCEFLGADTCIDYRLNTTNLNDQLKEYVKHEKKKFDMILDCVGGRSLFEICDDILELSDKGSAYVTIVGDSKDSPEAVPSRLSLSMLGRQWFGPFWGIRYIVHNVTYGKWLEVGAKLLEEGKLKIIIDSEYQWSDINRAFKRLVSRRAHGKIVLQLEDFA